VDFENETSPRLLDLCGSPKKHFFHPKVKGRLSLKAALPVVWDSNSRLHRHPAFSQYFKLNEAACAVDPYLTLPCLPFGNGAAEEEEVVTEGSGAMHAYQEMLDGLARYDEEAKENGRLFCYGIAS
jgi:hypothetical protein